MQMYDCYLAPFSLFRIIVAEKDENDIDAVSLFSAADDDWCQHAAGISHW